jgi:hypothetical protein
VRQGDRDELLEPTLQDYVAPTDAPWRLDSQFFVAFFGGPLALAGIAYINALRLGIPKPRRYAVLWIAAGALLAEIVALVVLDVTGALGGLKDNGTQPLRLINQAAGVLAYPFVRRVERSADRVYRLSHEDEDYSSLVGPGILAVIVGGLVGLGIVAWLVAALS